jgi:hypothetical protein
VTPAGLVARSSMAAVQTSRLRGEATCGLSPTGETINKSCALARSQSIRASRQRRLSMFNATSSRRLLSRCGPT